MTFFRTLQPEPEPEFDLPYKYDDIPYNWRHKVRAMYVREQKGLCCHCKHPLSEKPPEFIQRKVVNWDLFPENFMHSPVHLHHDHDTGMTVGAVHNYCNAVLWQYEGK